ncbi:heavy metal-binding domain-containing protein [Shewanella sp. 1_MG-2023]|nr:MULTISPECIES: heavy metal-binding domain-containing protein [unclassified Shewanella]MDO6611360.1 heavy metal-binding domain-containing protein [Shewanella sp. 7_MG-2023]MDO6771215.1 heavy metal-binding domain-containing protein [Shewanella sp. 2_MG-2023]MDO6795456.1 heavy metal-binding domain-containing protein [Shewanella sp. 1_MG-2023]
MNAEITGIAGDTCPNCGMDLMPIATSSSAQSHD